MDDCPNHDLVVSHEDVKISHRYKEKTSFFLVFMKFCGRIKQLVFLSENYWRPKKSFHYTLVRHFFSFVRKFSEEQKKIKKSSSPDSSTHTLT